MELFDVLDCTGRKTGGVIGRDEAHATGAWHGAFHCLAIFREDGEERALFQLRSRAKKITPGKFDVTVGGHYAAGEGPESAGPREISEELGLAVPFPLLVPVGRRVSVYCFDPGVREFEFQDVFLLPLAGMPRQYRLPADEVDALLALDIGRGIELFAGATALTDAVLYPREGVAASAAVAAADFVPSVDNYYLKLLVLARRYLAGERSALAI